MKDINTQIQKAQGTKSFLFNTKKTKARSKLNRSLKQPENRRHVFKVLDCFYNRDYVSQKTTG